MTRVALLLCLVGLAGCGSARSAASPRASSPSDRFDAPAAFTLIRSQVAIGQRVAGSPRLRRLAVRLEHRLPNGHFEHIPGDPRLRNVVGVVKGTKPALVIGAHYDTLVKPKGFVGANNGAAGTAIVVQLAHEAARMDRGAGAPELRFVLFDGEEPARGLPEETTDFYDAGLRGSRAYAKRHDGEVGAMVLLDYVAGAGLSLPREANSSAPLWAQVRAAAAGAGKDATFPDSVGQGWLDDHTPFLRAGVPAVDMIDSNYPGHSLKDGLDLLSVDSVDAVGETLVRFLAAWRS